MKVQKSGPRSGLYPVNDLERAPWRAALLTVGGLRHAKPRLWNTLPGAARTREVGGRGGEATEQASAALGEEEDYGVI